MARFKRLYTLMKMEDVGIVPIFYNSDAEIAKKIVKACADGGAKVVELTNRGDYAFEVFEELEKYAAKELPDVILGIGTIIEPYTAALYIARGANFIVSPVLNPELAKFCNRRKVPYLPGCGSVTEIQNAEELGCEIIKIFPAGELGGPKFVKSVKGPLPWTSFMPAGGVAPTMESLSEWFNAGVVCVGMGSKLITKEFVKKKDFAGITKNVENVLDLVKKIRGK